MRLGFVITAACGSASAFSLHPGSCAQSRTAPRATFLRLQLNGGGGDFLGDLAKGFKAGFAPKEAARAQDEAAERLRQAIEQQGPTPEQQAAAEQAKSNAQALEAKMARIKAAKAAREAASRPGASPAEDVSTETQGGRTTLSAEEGAAMFANIPQPKVLSAEEAQALMSSSAPPPSPDQVEPAAAAFGWANTETTPDEAKAAQIKALKEEAGDEAAARADAEAQGGRILSAEEEKALFAQAVAQAQAAQKAAADAQARAAAATSEGSPAQPAAGFGLAVPTTAQVKSYVESLAETDTAAAPDPAEVRAAAEAKAAKERELSKSTPQGGDVRQQQSKAWWQQALDAGGKIAAASADAVADANAKKRTEPVVSPLDPLTSMVKRGSKATLYKQLDQALDRDDFEAAAAIKRKIDAL